MTTTKPVCKHCNLTLQGSDNEGEDICVQCLTDLCFPSNNYSIIEGMIRQATDNPIKPNDTTEKTRNKPDQEGR